MRGRILIFLALAALMAIPAAAQAPPADSERPDYSKEALLVIIQDLEPPPGPRDPLRFYIPQLGTSVGFGVFPVSFGAGREQGATISPVPDPFLLSGGAIAYSERSFRDRYAEWRLRRKLGL